MNKRYKAVRRIIITGKREEVNKAFEFVWSNGYLMTRTGPIYIGNGLYDNSRFKIIAEKEIK